MTVTLADFTWAVRPTVSNNELTASGGIVASSGWSAGVGGWAAWNTTAALEALTDQYTIVVVVDPNQAATGYRGLLSVPAYASGAHVSPYHCIALGAYNGTSALFHHRTIANTGAAQTSGTGAINTATDGERCYAVRRNGNLLEFVVDGVLHTTTVTGTGPIDWSPHGPVCLGTRSASSPGEGCAGTYYFVGIANRWLTDDELVAITSDPLSFEGTPQTWDGSAGTLTITGNSGTFTPGARTWTGSTGTVTVSGVSGSFVPGASIWTGSTGTLTVAGVSGSFTPGARTWSGSTGTLLVSGVSGVFGSGTIWAGSSGSITVTGVSGAFLPGTAVWAGSSGAMAVSGTSSSFTPGDVEWLGSVGVIAVAGVSGSFSTQASLPTTETRSRVATPEARTLVAVTAARTMVITTEGTR